MTSSTCRPVSADVINHGGGGRSLSPAWHPTGMQCHSLLGDNTTSSPRDEVTSLRPPCCGHVTSVASQLLPVCDEVDANQSSGKTSSPQHRLSAVISRSSSRPLDDVTDLERSSFSHLRHASESHFEAWCPATLLALTAALQARSGVTNVARCATSPDASVLPLFRAPSEWPQSDLQRRLTPEDAAQLITGRPASSNDLLKAIDREIPPMTPMLPLIRAPPGWPHSCLQRRLAATVNGEPRGLRREPSRSTGSGVDQRRPSDADVLFSDTHSMGRLSRVSGLDPLAAASRWSSLPAGQLLRHPATPLNDLHHPHHRTHTGGHL